MGYVFEKSGKRAVIVISILYNITFAILSQEADDQLPDLIRQDGFKINALIQSGLRFSLADDNFQGGRTFEIYNARLSFSGEFAESFYYRVFFNIVDTPGILDAFAGFHHSNGLRIKAGAMKPSQTLDFIPDPGSHDFIDRSQITNLLVQSREIGISAEGDINDIYYFIGIFNGTGLSGNNNNSFYNIGRFQYTFNDILNGRTELGVNLSHGKTPGVRSGNSGPVLRGNRTIFGGDIRYETEQIMLSGEYLAGNMEVIDIIDNTESISGYYLTGGYNISDSTTALIRWQNWGYKIQNFNENQLTFGVNHEYTDIVFFRFNFDSYFPAELNPQHGFSLMIQIQF
jgi:hypothetical protein